VTASASPSSQRGATLVVGLIMLVLITLLVTSAFTLSTSGLKSVGNMQARDEAIAAGNKAIEQVVSSPFTASPTSESFNVDLNNDGTTDYVVAFNTPTCVSASTIAGTIVPPSSLSLGPAFSPATNNLYETVWDLDANVTDPKGSGAAVRVHQGVRVLLTQIQYNALIALSICS
jgi:Tfp pilus assembly protein PilX